MKRPGVESFIRSVCEIYEVVLYTASMETYGVAVLNYIDPEHLIPYRLFRDKCSLVRGKVVKNLAHLGRDLKDVVIVDNTPSSYSLQPCNGIPIKSWVGDKSDEELKELMPVLELLAKVDDVRDYLRELVIDDNINYEDAMKLLKGETQIARPELEFRSESRVAFESPRRSQSVLTLPKIIEDTDGESKASPVRTESGVLTSFPDKETWPSTRKESIDNTSMPEIIFLTTEESKQEKANKDERLANERASTDSLNTTASYEEITRSSCDSKGTSKFVDGLFELEESSSKRRYSFDCRKESGRDVRLESRNSDRRYMECKE